MQLSAVLLAVSFSVLINRHEKKFPLKEKSKILNYVGKRNTPPPYQSQFLHTVVRFLLFSSSIPFYTDKPHYGSSRRAGHTLPPDDTPPNPDPLHRPRQTQPQSLPTTALWMPMFLVSTEASCSLNREALAKFREIWPGREP